MRVYVVYEISDINSDTERVSVPKKAGRECKSGILLKMALEAPISMIRRDIGIVNCLYPTGRIGFLAYIISSYSEIPNN